MEARNAQDTEIEDTTFQLSMDLDFMELYTTKLEWWHTKANVIAPRPAKKFRPKKGRGAT
jgi:hypothetical protein